MITLGKPIHLFFKMNYNERNLITGKIICGRYLLFFNWIRLRITLKYNCCNFTTHTQMQICKEDMGSSHCFLLAAEYFIFKSFVSLLYM